MESFSTNEAGKSPQQILPGLYRFPPNRETLGGSAYLIAASKRSLLIDCPPWTEATQTFLQEQGGVELLFITHRNGASAQLPKIQAEFNCSVLIQEQEAYLFPTVRCQTFQSAYSHDFLGEAIWTPGYSPGSACWYWPEQGGVLFTGRHVLCNQYGQAVPLRTAKTFHWFRQLNSIGNLRDRFTPETLAHLCPGANVGLLRGASSLENPCLSLTQLDLTALRNDAIADT
ncbi:MAG: MBL fold metallo-hydrolase [Cyanobacteria bacterium P01_H01_bin.15]